VIFFKNIPSNYKKVNSKDKESSFYQNKMTKKMYKGNEIPPVIK